MDKISYTRLAFKMLLKEFTIGECKSMYRCEAISLFREYCKERNIKCDVTSAVYIALNRLMYLGYIKRKELGLYVTTK